jgi:Helicobacter pylori protein of unknown function (DUF874)
MRLLDKKLLTFIGLIAFGSGLLACNNSETKPLVSNISKKNTALIKSEEKVSTNSENINLAEEKAKLEQEKQKLEAEKTKLDQEKKEVANLKKVTPPDVDTEIWNGDIWQIHNPPSNIRVAPDGKILCTINKKTKIKLRGTSNVKDKTGEWLYTDVCGKIGFIHSSQVQMEDGVPAG